MRNYAGTCKSICSYNLVYNFLIQLLPLKSSVFVVHFSNAFWHGNKTFPKVSSQNKIVSLLVIFHSPYSKCRGVKICFFLCVSLSKLRFFTRVALVSFVFHSCRTRVVSVILVLQSCRSCLALVLKIRLGRQESTSAGTSIQ